MEHPDVDDDPRLAAYYRRRVDAATDRRFQALEGKVDQLDAKVDALASRLAMIAGALAILSIAANIIGPLIAQRIFGP